MRRLLIAGCAVGLFAARVGAWEVKRNPDRFISLGLHTSIEHLAGDHSNVLNPNTCNEIVQMENESSNVTAAGFDVRVPLFAQVTFTFAYDKIRRDMGQVRAGNTFQSYEGVSGDRVDMGVRFYFVK
jgi:hypothetical protein